MHYRKGFHFVIICIFILHCDPEIRLTPDGTAPENDLDLPKSDSGIVLDDPTIYPTNDSRPLEDRSGFNSSDGPGGLFDSGFTSKTDSSAPPSQDSGISTPQCGNGQCENGESCTTCSADCFNCDPPPSYKGIGPIQLAYKQGGIWLTPQE